jgi:hypothetical protein
MLQSDDKSWTVVAAVSRVGKGQLSYQVVVAAP